LMKVFSTDIAGTGTGSPVNVMVSNNNTAIPFGGLWCVTAPSGSLFDAVSVSAGLTAGTYNLFPLTVDPLLTAGNFRIVAKGFEVHNVSAELYKGGTVTVFSSPVDSYDTAQSFSMSNSGATATANASVLVAPQWPSSSTLAYSLVNSKQWEAREGCYVPGRINETEIPIEDGLNYTQPFYFSGESTITPIVGVAPQPLSSVVGISGVPQAVWENFNFTGSYFTGLTFQSSLTVNYLVIVENFPSSQDSIYSLAKPPPCRDDAALSMYSCMVREMPIGVPVAQNGLGDWFANAVSTVADYVSPVLSAIPHPATMAAGAALRASGNIARAYSTNPNANPNVGMSVPSGGGAASKAAAKLRNAEIRARNEEVRLRAAAKAAKKK